METTTTTAVVSAPAAEPKLSLGERLLADAPIFWKIVALLCGALMLGCALVLRYHLLPQFNGIIVDLVGPSLSAGWIVSQFAAKTPPPKSLNISDLYEYFTKLGTTIQPAQDVAHKPFDPATAPDNGMIIAQLKDLEAEMNIGTAAVSQTEVKE